LRSGGISFWQTTRPLFAAGVIFSLLMLAGNGWIVPIADRESTYILETKIEGKAAPVEITDDLYIRDGQRILSIVHSYPQRGEINGIRVLEFDQHFNLTRRLDAESARYAGNHIWSLQNVLEHRFSPENHQISSYVKLDELRIDLGRDPQELTETWSDPAEQTFFELRKTISRMQRDGQDPRRYMTELHFRMALSMVPLIVVLLGVPFALQRGRQATLGMGIALSLGVFVVYLLLQAIGMALGSAGLLPLPAAAWSANVLLLLVGAWLFLTLDS
jgi:LPS export ABC transporter permease LptG